MPIPDTRVDYCAAGRGGSGGGRGWGDRERGGMGGQRRAEGWGDGGWCGGEWGLPDEGTYQMLV